MQIDTNFHYLDIAAVESKDRTHFAVVTNDRTYSFSTTGDAGSFSSVSDDHTLSQPLFGYRAEFQL